MTNEKAGEVPEQADGLMQTSFRLTKDARLKFKICVEANGDTMQRVLEDFVSDYISKNSAALKRHAHDLK